MFINKNLFILSTIYSQIITKCDNVNHITLTFDDGPGDNTDKIVNILKRNNVTGTFFINGLNVFRQDRIKDLQKLINNGNTLGSHTFSHVCLEKVNNFNIYRELYDNELLFRLILNKRPRFFRPPYFCYNDHIVNIINDFGYTIVASNLDPLDWDLLNEEAIYKYFVDNLKQNNSFISLNHEQVTQFVNVLDNIIKYIKTQKFTIVNIEECLNLSNYQNDNTYDPNLINGIDKNIFNNK